MARSISYTDSAPTIFTIEVSDLTAVDITDLSGTIGARELDGDGTIIDLPVVANSINATDPTRVTYQVEFSYDETFNGDWELVSKNLVDTADPPNTQASVISLGEDSYFTIAVGVAPPTGSETVPVNAKIDFTDLTALPNNGSGWQVLEHAEISFSDGLVVKNVRTDEAGNPTPGLISGAIAAPSFNTQPGHTIEVEFVAPNGVNRTNAGVGAGLVKFNSIVDFSTCFLLAMNGYTYAPPNPSGGQYDFVSATPSMIEGDDYMVRIAFSQDKTQMTMTLFNVTDLEFDPQKREGVIWVTTIPAPEAMQASTRVGIDPGELPDGIKILSILY